MKRNRLLASVAVLSLVAMGAQAQQYAYPPPNQPPPPPAAAAPTLYAPPQLDQMLAPIALYPDPLLTEVLTGATYPDEIDQAARWSAANSSLSGPQLAATVEGYDWDPSVKSLAPFPQILALMDQHLDWTQQIGDAFMAQQPDVMDSIQRLRQQAYSAGALRSSPYESVVVSGGYIEIQPANPQIVYVPTYDPRQVYGNWAYGAYPPDYWGPPPGLQPRYEAGLLGFGVGIGVVGALWHWGDWDWAHHDVRVDRDRFNRINAGHGQAAAGPTWHHDAARPTNFTRGERPGEARPGGRPEPQQAARPAEQARPGEPPRPGEARPGGRPEPQQAARPAEQARPNEPPRPGQVRPGTRPEPQQAARPAEQARPGEPPRPGEARPGGRPEPQQAARPAEQARPNEPPRPGEVRPGTRPEPQQTARPAEQARPNEPPRPGEVRPGTRPEPQQAARPAEQARPNEPSRPATGIRPPPQQAVRPAEQARPNEPPRPGETRGGARPEQQQAARPPAEPARPAQPEAHPAQQRPVQQQAAHPPAQPVHPTPPRPPAHPAAPPQAAAAPHPEAAHPAPAAHAAPPAAAHPAPAKPEEKKDEHHD